MPAEKGADDLPGVIGQQGMGIAFLLGDLGHSNNGIPPGAVDHYKRNRRKASPLRQ